jgi:hypothetical protein
VVIVGNSIQLLTPEDRTSNANIKASKFIDRLLDISSSIFPFCEMISKLSEALPGISLTQHERTSQALYRNSTQLAIFLANRPAHSRACVRR